jgi:hypothetical protein
MLTLIICSFTTTKLKSCHKNIQTENFFKQDPCLKLVIVAMVVRSEERVSPEAQTPCLTVVPEKLPIWYGGTGCQTPYPQRAGIFVFGADTGQFRVRRGSVCGQLAQEA